MRLFYSSSIQMGSGVHPPSYLAGIMR